MRAALRRSDAAAVVCLRVGEPPGSLAVSSHDDLAVTPPPAHASARSSMIPALEVALRDEFVGRHVRTLIVDPLEDPVPAPVDSEVEA